MAIVGIGTDIVEIERISAQLARSSRLAERILSPVEMQRFVSEKEPARYLAKRFAAKEAAVKALGTGIGQGVGFQQISVENNAAGAPFLVVTGEYARLCQQRGVTTLHVTISDERHYATATVVLEK